MTRARKHLVSLETTSYYHCVCRCVRRAFLCGHDQVTGHSFEHRKQWVVDRLRELTKVFAVNVAAYAVMSNHYHVILQIDTARALAWSEADVATRWHRLFRGPDLIQQYPSGKSLSPAEIEAANASLRSGAAV